MYSLYNILNFSISQNDNRSRCLHCVYTRVFSFWKFDMLLSKALKAPLSFQISKTQLTVVFAICRQSPPSIVTPAFHRSTLLLYSALMFYPTLQRFFSVSSFSVLFRSLVSFQSLICFNLLICFYVICFNLICF